MVSAVIMGVVVVAAPAATADQARYVAAKPYGPIVQHQSVVVVAPHAYSQRYGTGWHGGYPDVGGQERVQSWAPPAQIYINNRYGRSSQISIFNVPNGRGLMVQNNTSLPVSVRLRAPSEQERLPTDWHKHYQVGDTLDGDTYNRGKVIARMPRGTVRLRIDNVVMHLDEDTRKILSISLR